MPEGGIARQEDLEVRGQGAFGRAAFDRLGIENELAVGVGQGLLGGIELRTRVERDDALAAPEGDDHYTGEGLPRLGVDDAAAIGSAIALEVGLPRDGRACDKPQTDDTQQGGSLPGASASHQGAVRSSGFGIAPGEKYRSSSIINRLKRPNRTGS